MATGSQNKHGTANNMHTESHACIYSWKMRSIEHHQFSRGKIITMTVLQLYSIHLISYIPYIGRKLKNNTDPWWPQNVWIMGHKPLLGLHTMCKKTWRSMSFYDSTMWKKKVQHIEPICPKTTNHVFFSCEICFLLIQKKNGALSRAFLSLKTRGRGTVRSVEVK